MRASPDQTQLEDLSDASFLGKLLVLPSNVRLDCKVFGLNLIKLFFPSLLTMIPNKLERLSLETLSGKVLDFEGKARANPIGAHFRCFLLG